MSGMQDFELLLARRTAFNPITSLGASLLGYFDAESALSVPQSAGAVTTWTDPITGLAPTQGTAGKRPIWGAANLNGRPAVRFDGVDDELSFTGAVTYPSGSAGGEIWALTSQDALVADTGLRVLFDYGGSTSAYLGLIRSVVSSVNRATSAKGASASNNVNVDLSGVHVLRHIWTATGMSVEVDGTAGTGGSDSTAIASTVTLKIGSFVNSTLFWNGTINSIWLTAPLSAGQAASMLAYLKTRGGVP